METEVKKILPRINFDDIQIVGSIQEEPKVLSSEEIEKNKLMYEEHLKNEWAENVKSGIPKRFQKSTFDNYITETKEEKDNLALCKNFVEGKGRQMLFFVGRYGNGKTHLGSAIVRESRRLKGRFTTSFEICTRYEMGSDFKAEENRWQVLERFINYEILVIDEFGRGKPEIERLIIPYIINARYENLKRTVLITNLEKDKAVDILGGACVDRLREICSTLVFSEESKRG